MRALVEGVVAAGGRRAALAAKVFGGACAAAMAGGRNLGAENAAVALRFLEAAGIPVDAVDVGGSRGRRVAFRPHAGEADVKLL
jgi:chemotaxis protein CheD